MGEWQQARMAAVGSSVAGFGSHSFSRLLATISICTCAWTFAVLFLPGRSVGACTGGGCATPLVMPWGYVFRNYVKGAGDRWEKALRDE